MWDRIVAALLLAGFLALRFVAWRLRGTSFGDRLSQDTRGLSWIILALAAGMAWGGWL